MAITFLKRSSLPAPVKGKEGTFSASIADNGQVSLSSKCTKWIGAFKLVAFAFDAGKVYLFRPDSPIVKRAKIDEKDMVTLRSSKKQPNYSFAASALLKDANTFGDHIYDYKNSGNQTFPVTVDEKNLALVFELPKGTLAKKPVTHRKKKETPASVKAEAGSTEATPQAVAAEDELTLDAA